MGERCMELTSFLSFFTRCGGIPLRAAGALFCPIGSRCGTAGPRLWCGRCGGGVWRKWWKTQKERARRASRAMEEMEQMELTTTVYWLPTNPL